MPVFASLISYCFSHLPTEQARDQKVPDCKIDDRGEFPTIKLAFALGKGEDGV